MNLLRNLRYLEGRTRGEGYLVPHSLSGATLRGAGQYRDILTLGKGILLGLKCTVLKREELRVSDDKEGEALKPEIKVEINPCKPGEITGLRHEIHWQMPDSYSEELSTTIAAAFLRELERLKCVRIRYQTQYKLEYLSTLHCVDGIQPIV